jgi:hypothetical protein
MRKGVQVRERILGNSAKRYHRRREAIGSMRFAKRKRRCRADRRFTEDN